MSTPTKVLNWSVVTEGDYTFAHFEISDEGGLLRESDLRKIELPAEAHGRETRGLILSGKGPVWLYAYLTHLGHAFAWLAVYDPRLAGAVVVSRHRPDAPAVGSVSACSPPPEATQQRPPA